MYEGAAGSRVIVAVVRIDEVTVELADVGVDGGPLAQVVVVVTERDDEVDRRSVGGALEWVLLLDHVGDALLAGSVVVVERCVVVARP